MFNWWYITPVKFTKLEFVVEARASGLSAQRHSTQIQPHARHIHQMFHSANLTMAWNCVYRRLHISVYLECTQNSAGEGHVRTSNWDLYIPSGTGSAFSLPGYALSTILGFRSTIARRVSGLDDGFM